MKAILFLTSTLTSIQGRSSTSEHTYGIVTNTTTFYILSPFSRSCSLLAALFESLIKTFGVQSIEVNARIIGLKVVITTELPLFSLLLLSPQFCHSQCQFFIFHPQSKTFVPSLCIDEVKNLRKILVTYLGWSHSHYLMVGHGPHDIICLCHPFLNCLQ